MVPTVTIRNNWLEWFRAPGDTMNWSEFHLIGIRWEKDRAFKSRVVEINLIGFDFVFVWAYGQQ